MYSYKAGREFLESIGYITRCETTLNKTGIRIPLCNNFYRDDGFVDSLFEHTIHFLLYLQWIDKEIMVGYLDYYNKNKGLWGVGETTGHVGKLAYGFCDYSTRIVKGKILSKAIKRYQENNPLFLDKRTIDKLHLFSHAHEETHIIAATNNLHHLRDWFRSRGLNKINPYELMMKEGEEYLAHTTGAVLVKTETSSIDELVPYNNVLEDIQHRIAL